MTRDELRAKIGAPEKRNGRTRYARTLVDAVLEHVAASKAAGESLTLVAKDLGIRAGTVQRWWERSRARRSAGTVGLSSRRNERAPSVSPMAFIRLEPSPEARDTRERLEVVLSGGVSVRVPVGFDAGTLARVLTLVKEVAP